MSAAIKRLSTIIKPHNSSPSKETTKETTDSADPAAATETPTQMAPTIEAPVANGDSAATPADANAVKDTITAPDGETVAIPTSTTEEANDAQDVPVPAATETETAKDVATDAEKDKESKPTPRRRDPRDIGLSTIRRFSTILRSQGKDAHKETPPPVPTSTQKEDGEAQAVSTESAAGTDAVAAAPEPAKDDAKATKDDAKSSEKDAKPAEKDAAAATEASKAKSNGDAAAPTKRRSSFFSAVQRTAKDVQTRARGPAKPKAAPKPKIEAVVVPKIVKKGAARGKRVVVVTGASKGVGLEIVKQFASQPDTFVIALSRTADKASALKPVISASAKTGHNIRAIKLDVASSRSIHNVVKDIVELTDGRVDLVINAAGSRGDPALKVWELKGSELEDELRTNLVGPIAFTNALIPYLKPVPPKEEKKAEVKTEAKEEAKAEVKEEKVEAKEEKTTTNEKTAERLDVKEQVLDAKEPAVVATTVEPSIEAPNSTVGGDAAPVPAETAPPPTATDAPAEPAPVTETSAVAIAEPAATQAAAEPTPSPLPTHPFILFLAPADPIQNVSGTVPTGSAFAPSPRTLFSLSRAALQVAIAKYASGLGGKGVGIVGVERSGVADPHSTISDAQAATGILKLLPELSTRDNGKLLRAD